MDTETRLRLVYNDKRWRKLRKIVLSHFPNCVCCTAKAQVLDHIYPIQQHALPKGGLGHAFDARNVQGLCRLHHDVKTNRIDAPLGRVAKYRYDLSHEADMRPQAMKDWANWFHDSGEQLQKVGSIRAGEGISSRTQLVGDISC